MIRTMLLSIAVLAGTSWCLAGRLAQRDPDVGLTTLPTIRVGHVGHDHQLALYVAALESESRKAIWGVSATASRHFEL